MIKQVTRAPSKHSLWGDTDHITHQCPFFVRAYLTGKVPTLSWIGDDTTRFHVLYIGGVSVLLQAQTGLTAPRPELPAILVKWRSRQMVCTKHIISLLPTPLIPSWPALHGGFLIPI